MWNSTSFAAVADEIRGTSSARSSSLVSLPSWLLRRRSVTLNNQNAFNESQTLEEAFARLSLAMSSFDPPSLDFDRDGRTGINTGSKSVPFDLLGFNHNDQRTVSSTGQVQPQWNSIIGSKFNSGNSHQNSGDGGQWNSFWSGSGGYMSSGSLGKFLDSEPSLRQNGLGIGLPSVSLSNGVVGELLRRNNSSVNNNGALNNEFMVNNESRLNDNGMVSFCLSNLQGRIVLLAKDEEGSRALKDMMQLLTPGLVDFFFSELINDIADLMVDPFGNHVVQRLVEICDEQQRNAIIGMILNNKVQFLKICLNPLGVRAVEKVLEHVTTQLQRTSIVIGLIPGVAALAKDVNGHRVILHCLKHFPQGDSKHLFAAVASNCFGIATDKTGCCMLQECVRYAEGQTKLELISEIIANVSFLAEDCYGNYVVQHLLSLKVAGVTECVLRRLEGTFFHLSSNKYGSNVVEKFFQFSDDLHSARIITELLYHPTVAMLLVDPYGNYVMQTALMVSKGNMRAYLVNLIQHNSPMMRYNTYGKKVLERFYRVTKLPGTLNRVLLPQN